MSDTLTADLETGAGVSATPELESQSLGSLMDDALEMDAGDEVSTAPTEQTPVPGVDRGDGRDVHGKFATKAEQDAANAAAAAIATKPGEVPVAPKPGEPRPAAANAFRYRALGQTHALEGATVNEDGSITVPAAKAGDVREALNALHLVRGEYAPAIEGYKSDIAGLTAKLTEATEGRGLRETQAAALVDGLMKMTEIEDPGARLQAVWDFLQTLPAFKQEQELKYWRERAEQPAKPAAPAAAAPAPNTPTMPTPDAARATTGEYLEQAKIHHDFRSLAPDDWKQIEARYQATPFAFLRLATAEDTATNPSVAPGTVVFDVDAMAADIRTHADAVTKQRETARGQTELATRNARRTQTSVNAPPVAGGTQIPAKLPKQPNKHQSLESLLDDALADE